MAAMPTPPQPMTATDAPGGTRAVLITAPTPGHHPAADQCGHFVGHVGRELHHALLWHHHFLGERAAAGHAEGGHVTDQEARLQVGGDDVGHAQIRLAAQAGRARAARRQPVDDDPVPGGEAGHSLAHGQHVTGRLVTENGRHRLGQPAVARGQIRWHTPAARTRILTWPGPGPTASTSSRMTNFASSIDCSNAARTSHLRPRKMPGL
jgi:hypothetical protein